MPERLVDITFFSAYQEIVSSVEILESLYTVWRNLPRNLQLSFWVEQSQVESLTIHQKFFVFTCVPFSFLIKKELYKFDSV